MAEFSAFTFSHTTTVSCFLDYANQRKSFPSPLTIQTEMPTGDKLDNGISSPSPSLPVSASSPQSSVFLSRPESPAHNRSHLSPVQSRFSVINDDLKFPGDKDALHLHHNRIVTQYLDIMDYCADCEAHESTFDTYPSTRSPCADRNTSGDIWASDAEYDHASAGSKSTFDEVNDLQSRIAMSEIFDAEKLLSVPEDTMQIDVADLNIPSNRARLEWHGMLTSVLTGDVVKQEKKRLIASGDSPEQMSEVKHDMWIEIRARVCDRTFAAQRRLIHEAQKLVPDIINDVISFSIKEESETNLSPSQQINLIIQKIERAEILYPTHRDFLAANPVAATHEYLDVVDAIFSWYNTSNSINLALLMLRKLVGNDELNSHQPIVTHHDAYSNQGVLMASSNDKEQTISSSQPDFSFVDRVLRYDGLKILAGSKHGNEGLIRKLETLLCKVKQTIVRHHRVFQQRNFPSFEEDLRTLINFPSRLLKEIINKHLAMTEGNNDTSKPICSVNEHRIRQFQVLLRLAVCVKEIYKNIIDAEIGWNLQACLEPEYNTIVLKALGFYFKMLNWKLSASKNVLKEAEILETEWESNYVLGRSLENGDIHIAVQFSMLTSKCLKRLALHFEMEMRRSIDYMTKEEAECHYKQILDAVRVRQRKIFRFCRILRRHFENCAEYYLPSQTKDRKVLLEALAQSGHVLVQCSAASEQSIMIIASPALKSRLDYVQHYLDSCYIADEAVTSPGQTYILIIRPEPKAKLTWTGCVVERPLSLTSLGMKLGRLRIVSSVNKQQLQESKNVVLKLLKLKVAVEYRASLHRVNFELQRVRKCADKLSRTIIDGVDVIRKQTQKLGCQELIQACFTFATEFGQRSSLYMDHGRRAMTHARLTRLALEWVNFICDDCVPSDRRTFRWAVVALEFVMVMTHGNHIISLSKEAFSELQRKVARCMSILISHFDIMGARSTIAAELEKQRAAEVKSELQLDLSRVVTSEESLLTTSVRRCKCLESVEQLRRQRDTDSLCLGQVIEGKNEAERALTRLSASSGNVTLRWQINRFVGGGTFGNVYTAVNFDSGQLMAVKEIRLRDPNVTPEIVGQIRDEMGVLQVLNHPNIVNYFGIEPHRDKVYIFMEYCGGGSLASLLEHGAIVDENIIQVYVLEMLEGLVYLHENRVVHRDIKPQNILFNDAGVIKFVDFGASKVIARKGGTYPGTSTAPYSHKFIIPNSVQPSITGTPMYMAPEMIIGNPGEMDGKDAAADIWSLGCVILEMVTGRRPWCSLDNEWAIMFNIGRSNPPQLEQSLEILSDSGSDFLKQCFKRDPMKRATAEELLKHKWMAQVRKKLNLNSQYSKKNFNYRDS